MILNIAELSPAERDRLMEQYIWDRNPESRIAHDPRDAVDLPVSSDWADFYASRGLMHPQPDRRQTVVIEHRHTETRTVMVAREHPAQPTRPQSSATGARL